MFRDSKFLADIFAEREALLLVDSTINCFDIITSRPLYDLMIEKWVPKNILDILDILDI